MECHKDCFTLRNSSTLKNQNPLFLLRNVVSIMSTKLIGSMFFKFHEDLWGEGNVSLY
jgi:hypothetical protein